MSRIKFSGIFDNPSQKTRTRFCPLADFSMPSYNNVKIKVIRKIDNYLELFR